MRDVNFERLTKRAIAIYTQERAALLDSNLDALAEAKVAKAGLLAELENAEAALNMASEAEASEQTLAQISSLHSIIERRTSENKQLARANHLDARPE